ncbi:MAG: SLATT domain-containing protein [Pseudomonadota bacterium]
MWNRPPTHAQIPGTQIPGPQTPADTRIPTAHLPEQNAGNVMNAGNTVYDNGTQNPSYQDAYPSQQHIQHNAQVMRPSPVLHQQPALTPQRSALPQEQMMHHQQSPMHTHNPMTSSNFVLPQSIAAPQTPRFHQPTSSLPQTQGERSNLDAELQFYVSSKQQKDLLDRMNLVKRACFNAHSRLRQKHRVSIFTLSLISLFVVAISLYALTYGTLLPIGTKSAITFASIISSVFIIIVGLLESQNNYQVRAIELHKCAMEITDIHQKLQIESSLSREDLQKYADKYQNAIQSCSYNHDDIDYVMAKISGRRGQDIGWDLTLQVYLTYYIDVYGLSFIILSIPPAILLWL